MSKRTKGKKTNVPKTTKPKAVSKGRNGAKPTVVETAEPKGRGYHPAKSRIKSGPGGSAPTGDSRVLLVRVPKVILTTVMAENSPLGTTFSKFVREVIQSRTTKSEVATPPGSLVARGVSAPT